MKHNITCIEKKEPGLSANVMESPTKVEKSKNLFQKLYKTTQDGKIKLGQWMGK